MKLSETIRGLPVAIDMTKHQREFVRGLADEVAQLEAKNKQLRGWLGLYVYSDELQELLLPWANAAKEALVNLGGVSVTSNDSPKTDTSQWTLEANDETE